MPKDLKSLNSARTEQFRKDEGEETFLEQLNNTLLSFERQNYQDISPQHPFLFVIGLPRSGTTLLSQLLAHCLDTGYINNLAARFWKTPVTGIKFADSILNTNNFRAFESRYGSTGNLSDIHEFGYFWREWLKKDAFENIKNARQMEDQIDWEGLKKTLANMQAQFDRPMVFKNIFGSYHIPKLNEVLEKTLWVYIERDPLDTAVSILGARKKYYTDLNKWWSYLPPDYEKIIDKDYWHQIAGQIHYLKKFYRRELEQLKHSGQGLAFSYKELCDSPASILKIIQKRIEKLYKVQISVAQQPPSRFEYYTYDNHAEEKKRFSELINSFE